MYTYKYPRPAVAVDIVVFGLDIEDLKILLIQRDLDPFKGRWALPGGFTNPGETLEETAVRELEEETNLSDIYIEQLYTFSDPERDPREQVISVTYYGLVNLSEHSIEAASDARNAAWFGLNHIPELAFDHDKILTVALTRLKGKIKNKPIGFELLPTKFPLRSLQTLYEKILERKLDKRNFRKKIMKMGILKELDEREKDVPHRAARLYTFDKKAYNKKIKQGFNFEI
jgi:8-oxo-dGTP diphosphatase